ncbi:MAG: two-component sensor histidine kinase, partial [Magnetospirillum sp.]|nr:two-component sensor histidine kinase [Magnetospirillum sp.]
MAIIVATTALIGVYCLVAFSNIRAMERERLEFSEAEARKILLSFETHSVRLLDFADTYLRAARHFYMTESLDDLPHFLDEVAPPKADIFSSALAILDAQGRLVYSSDRNAPRNADLSDQAAFTHFQLQPTDHLFIGSANASTVASHQYIHIARPVLAGKTFRGLMLLTIHSSQIAAFYRDMTLGPNSSAAMFSMDKTLLARQPPPVAEAAPMGTLQIWADSEAKPEGRFSKRSLLDGVQRTFLYRRLADYPLIVVVGFADSDVSEGLKPAVRASIFEASLFVATAMAFCVLLLVTEKRNQRLMDAELASRAAAEKLERS